MKKTLLTICTLIVCQVTLAQMNFTNKADMPTARAGSSAAVYGGFEYVANGFSPGQPYTSQIEKYDFLNNSWSTLATSPATIAKCYGNAAIFSNIMYLYNGVTDTGSNNDFEIIELGTGNVSVIPDVNPNPVYNAGGAVYGDYLLSFGGCVNEWAGTYSNKLYKIAPWGEWTALADMPVALETKGTVVYENGNAKLYAFGGYSQTDGIHENFETVATTGDLSLSNWINVAETGGKLFQGKTFQSNKYAQITAFSSATQDDSNVSWLISPVIPFSVTDNTFLTFDTKDGFDNGATLQAYIITNWTGNIATSTKTLLNANISSGHTTGYAADFTHSGPIALAGNPGNFRIAFKYTGGYSPLATTTFQIDNVKVYYEYKSRNVYIYDFEANTWTTQWDVLPQELSAHAVAIEDAFASGAKIYVSGDYSNQTFLGAYDTGNGTFQSISQTNMIGRRHHRAEVFGSKLYLFGGNTSTQASSALNSTQSADLPTLATETFNNSTAISFYPNPTTDKITFNSKVKTVLLFTFEGKKVDAILKNNELDLSALSAGIYLIQGMDQDGNRFSDKLIKK